MVRAGENRHFFPLTSLQIGDLQSYLAELTIFLCPHTKKFLILLDNRPWLLDQDTKPAHLWQLMVTKSRFSPFANSRARRRRDETDEKLVYSTSSVSAPHLQNKSSRWYSLIDDAMREKKLQVNKLKDARILNRELHQTLYGFIIFEVDWADVRGINYLNELQTDTSMVVESKIMKRWEFDSVKQASTLIASWFSGNPFECQLLQDYLTNISSNGDIFYDAQNDFLTPEWDSENLPSDSDDSSHVQIIRESSGFTDSSYTTPPCSGPYKRRKITKSDDGSSSTEESYTEIVASPKHSSSSCSSCDSDNENAKPLLEPSTYKDVLICFRFDDHDLPFGLKEVILSDVRLLTLLEYGLPSWVIFLQSYPVFCKIYRPWMCPLARALYVLMSLITVLIGFYDLYKNVPMLKATASRLFGPLFDWIETWEMISRLKYLGTMLFLHNFQQAFTWSLKIVGAAKSALSVLTKPIAGPILEVFELTMPIWNLCAETVGYLSSVVMLSVEVSWSVVIDTVEMIVWPFWFVFSTMVSIGKVAVTSCIIYFSFLPYFFILMSCYFCLSPVNSILYPIIWLLGEILAAPFRLVIGLSSFVVDLFVDIINFLRGSWSTLSALYQVGSVPRSPVLTSDNNIWASLWKDLLYQIFRALRSILYGFVAFFSTCNRHRLSIYNHIQVFLRRISHVPAGARFTAYLDGTRKYSSQNHHRRKAKTR
uniref:G1/S-specific cyclin-E protein n=1 Tax=Zea mays TaxID=4577 RepID=A0A804PN51_MAIZE